MLESISNKQKVGIYLLEMEISVYSIPKNSNNDIHDRLHDIALTKKAISRFLLPISFSSPLNIQLN